MELGIKFVKDAQEAMVEALTMPLPDSVRKPAWDLKEACAELQKLLTANAKTDAIWVGSDVGGFPFFFFHAFYEPRSAHQPE